jgi:predicted O-methyltransferase YrrM
MEHFYQNIDGWFDYEDLYSLVVKALPNDSHIVEVGAWKGRSSAYLAVEAINSGKNIKVDIVDNWTGGSDAAEAYAKDKDMIRFNHNIFEFFKQNLSPVIDKITPIQMLSHEAANLYEDKSLDFVFIDANHTYDFVKRDINAWLPKMKPGSFFAGHDYNPTSWPGVIKAVHEFFPKEKVAVMRSSWLTKL